jgi:hypothetical protein
MKTASLPPLKSPAAYLRDALKKGYTTAGEGTGDLQPRPLQTPALPPISAQLERLREEWYLYKVAEAKQLFTEMPNGEQAEHIERFEDERLPELAPPIAKAWRRDGLKSKIAAGSFHRWLAFVLWPAEVTDKELLEFAMSRRA